jgi:hypothetical protein
LKKKGLEITNKLISKVITRLLMAFIVGFIAWYGGKLALFFQKGIKENKELKVEIESLQNNLNRIKALSEKREMISKEEKLFFKNEFKVDLLKASGFKITDTTLESKIVDKNKKNFLISGKIYFIVETKDALKRLIGFVSLSNKVLKVTKINKEKNKKNGYLDIVFITKKGDKNGRN